MQGAGEMDVLAAAVDCAATPARQVNDLDLTVRAAGLGNVPLLGNGGSVVTPGEADHENTVEQVRLASVPAGNVSIAVQVRAGVWWRACDGNAAAMQVGLLMVPSLNAM